VRLRRILRSTRRRPRAGRRWWRNSQASRRQVKAGGSVSTSSSIVTMRGLVLGIGALIYFLPAWVLGLGMLVIVVLVAIIAIAADVKQGRVECAPDSPWRSSTPREVGRGSGRETSSQKSPSSVLMPTTRDVSWPYATHRSICHEPIRQAQAETEPPVSEQPIPQPGRPRTTRLRPASIGSSARPRRWRIGQVRSLTELSSLASESAVVASARNLGLGVLADLQGVRQGEPLLGLRGGVARRREVLR
jgi:hypothetical protein